MEDSREKVGQRNLSRICRFSNLAKERKVKDSCSRGSQMAVFIAAGLSLVDAESSQYFLASSSHGLSLASWALAHFDQEMESAF